MDVSRLGQHASLKCSGPPHHSSVKKGIVSHGFHKLIVAFSSISPSQYSYFDVGRLFYKSIHSARRLTYNWVSITLCVITVELTALYCSVYVLHANWRTLFFFMVSSFKCEGKNSCHYLIPNPYSWTSRNSILTCQQLC
jgi:hypothetical protein